MAAHRPNAYIRLFRGETSFDFCGRWKIWFGISGMIILIGLISIGTRGLNFSIDFKGGTVWEVPSSASVSQARAAVGGAVPGMGQSTVQILTNTQTHKRTIKVSASANLTGNATDVSAVTNALAKMAGVSPNDVQLNDIGPSWGSDITNKAVRAVIVFLIVVSVYIWLRFEAKMALAALTALVHDILITAGIYSLSGFQVSPDTVIAFLTILGYSLYDTIVVFDRVQENTRGLASTNRMTYTDTVNLSMNQVLARSLNTSLFAIRPIITILVIVSWVLGATALNDFGLALFIGLTTGAYSSIFIASPLLALLKEREPRYSEIRRRLAQGSPGRRRITPAAAATGNLSGVVAVATEVPASSVAVKEHPYGSDALSSSDADADGDANGSTDSTSIPLRTTSTPPRSGTRPPPRPRKKGRRRGVTRRGRCTGKGGAPSTLETWRAPTAG